MFRANFCPSSGAQDCATLLLSESLPTTTRRHYTICCKKSQSCAPEVGQNFARNMFSLFTYQTFQWLYFHEASVYTLSHNCRTSCRNSNFRDFTKKKSICECFLSFFDFPYLNYFSNTLSQAWRFRWKFCLIWDIFVPCLTDKRWPRASPCALPALRRTPAASCGGSIVDGCSQANDPSDNHV